MSIPLPTFLRRSNPNTVPYLMEDTDLKGGFRIVDDHVKRDSIHSVARLPGMLVLTRSDGIIWQLLDDKLSWVEWTVGGGGGGGTVTSASDPLAIDVSGDLSIDPNRILPSGGNAGDIPVRQSGGSVAWEANAASGSVATRTTITKTDFSSLAVSDSTNFTLSMSRSCLLVEVTVNAPDLLIQCFSTPTRDDQNPYTFKSATGRLTDIGVSELPNGDLQYNRRYAFVLNQESPTTTDLYWSVTNQGSIAVTPVLTVKYLVLE